MNTQTIELAPLDLRASVGQVNRDNRSVELVFSTGAAVERHDWLTGSRYIERLSLDPKHVRLERLNAGAPLLNAHSAFSLVDQIGVVVERSAVVDGREGRATVRFSKRPDADRIFQDVLDRIIRNVSVGYRVYRFEETPGRGSEPPTRDVTDWEPFEISMVPMGADAAAQVRGSHAVLTNPCLVVAGAGTILRTDAERIRRLTALQDEDRCRRLEAARRP